MLEETFKLNMKRQRLVVLCEKILFMFKNIPENKLFCKCDLNLNNIVLFDNVNGINNAFEIQLYGSKKTSYILQAKTSETKKRWIIQIKRLLLQTMAVKLSSQNMEALFGSRDACSIQQALTVSNENKKNDKFLVEPQSKIESTKSIYSPDVPPPPLIDTNFNNSNKKKKPKEKKDDANSLAQSSQIKPSTHSNKIETNTSTPDLSNKASSQCIVNELKSFTFKKSVKSISTNNVVEVD